MVDKIMAPLSTEEIQQMVLGALRHTNLARTPESQLECSPTAKIFAPGSPLDSLGLVSFLVDVNGLKLIGSARELFEK
jgi:hypothetical protein